MNIGKLYMVESKLSNSAREQAHPGLRDALVLMAPNDKVEKARQVAFAYTVLGILGVGHSVLVQHKDVKPLCIWYLLTCSWSDPAELHSAQTILLLLTSRLHVLKVRSVQLRTRVWEHRSTAL